MFIRKFAILMLLSATSLSIHAQSSASNSRPDLKEISVRGGLSNFIAKAERGDTLHVAYLGGSITASDGWRPMSLAWFATQYPKAHFVEINAAVSGTGSTLGAFRIDQDVLRFHPDLVFVEFAVNDKEDSKEAILRAMEGIVRKTWISDPNTDICFIYTISTTELAPLQRGELPVSSAAMETIAEHYQIPSINFGISVAALAKQDKLIFQGPINPAVPTSKIIFSPDGTHPYPSTGHRLYISALQRGMEVMKTKTEVNPHVLPAALVPFNLEQAKELPLSSIAREGDWHIVSLAEPTGQMTRSLPVVWAGKAATDTLTVEFTGTLFGLYGVKGPDVGNFSVQIDKDPPIVTTLFDPFSTAGRYRLRPWISPLLTDSNHKVTIRVLGTNPDKAKILGKLNHNVGDSEEFSGSTIYLGDVLISGTVIPEK